MATESMGSRTAISGQLDGQNPSESAVPERPRRNRYAFMCAVFASTASIIQGYVQGVMGGAVIFIKKHFQLSHMKVGVIVSVICIYGLIGTAVAGRTSDYIGRRYTMILVGFIFFFGAFLVGFATNYVSLMLGQSIIGLGLGYATIASPVYIAEVSPTSSRGFFTSLSKVFINFGMMLGCLSNFLFSKLPIHLGWRFMIGIVIFPSMFLIVVILMIPESPHWLVMNGQIENAKWVLEKTSDSLEEAEQRLTNIKEANGIPSSYSLYDVIPLQASTLVNHTMDVWKELFLHPTPSIRHILITIIGLHVFQQISGITVLLFYYSIMVQKVGFKSNNHMLLAMIAIGFTETIFSLVATFLLDKIGRRPLLLTSAIGKTISLTFLGFRLTKINHHSHVKLTWDIELCITMVLLDIAFFSVGMGTITGVYSSEILPTKLRAQGLSLGVIVSTITVGVVGMTFIFLANAITIGGVFFFSAGIAVMSWVFFYVLLPETQGRSLEDTEGLFGSFI